MNDPHDASRRTALLTLVLAAVPTFAWRGVAAAGFSEGDAAQAVRAALERGSAAAVQRLGRNGGFLDNPSVRIALPPALQDVARLARLAGQQARVDELVVAMNRAAEAAVPEGRSVLVQAVRSMSVEDARQIVTGDDQSVTRYFDRKTRQPLTLSFAPVVARSMQRVALADKLDAVAGRAVATGLVRREDADLKTWVTGKTLDGLYRLIGEEERRIRQDPVGTGSALLSRVFGSLR